MKKNYIGLIPFMLCLCVHTSIMKAVSTITINGKQITTGRVYELGELIDDPVNVIEQFEGIIKSYNVLIDCCIPNCSPCAKTAPEFAKLAYEVQDVLFIEVNAHYFYEIASAYSIKGAPTFIYFKRGKEVSRRVGESKKRDLKHLLK